MGGFLEIVDNSTGGGSCKFQLKIFKTSKGIEVLGVNKVYNDGVVVNAEVSFYYLKNKLDITSGTWLDFSDSDFYKSGNKPQGNEDLMVNEYFYSNFLPTSNNMQCFHGFLVLDNECKDGNKKACEIKKELYGKFNLKWLPAKISFEIMP